MLYEPLRGPTFKLSYIIPVQDMEEHMPKGNRSVNIPNLPHIVCLCGSTRFSQAFQEANLEETLKGFIVLTIGCDMRSDSELFAGKSESYIRLVKQQLDELHLRKIDLADQVLILNVGGYIGESTQRELDYALSKGKVVRYLQTPASAQHCIRCLRPWEKRKTSRTQVCPECRKVMDDAQVSAKALR